MSCLVSKCSNQFLDEALSGRHASVISLHTAHVVKCHYCLLANHQRSYMEKSVEVISALGSAHEKVRRLKRCRPFAVLFNWCSRIERRVDPNTNLSNLIVRKSNLLGSAHKKFDVWNGPKALQLHQRNYPTKKQNRHVIVCCSTLTLIK